MSSPASTPSSLWRKMRNSLRLLLILTLPAPLGRAADDSLAVFEACAYVSSAAPVRSSVIIAMPRHPLRVGERFSLTVTSSFDGYVYVFQDPADPAALVFPASPAQDHRISKGRAWEIPGVFGFRDRNTKSLMVGVSRQPVSDFKSMSAQQIRRFFEQRRFCEGFAWAEKAIQYQE